MSEHKNTTYCIHIFRRDYRLEDNTSLIEACKTHDIVIPVFIFNKKQITKENNPYRSDNCVQFLCESLNDLNTQIVKASNSKSQLYIYYVDSEIVFLESLIKLFKKSLLNLKSISFNMDYTKYSRERYEDIEKLCKKNSISILNLDDICLNPIGTVLNGSGQPYTKFTPFWRASAKKDIKKCVSNNYKDYLDKASSIGKTLLKLNDKTGSGTMITINDVMETNGKYGIMGQQINDKLPEKGGRSNGLEIIHRIKNWNDYNDERDMLSYKTTHLSPFNKFGCVSIREVYWAMHTKLGAKGDDGLIRQLFWRDFFYNLSHFHPEIYSEKALNPKYREIKWDESSESKLKFKKWCNGETGYPVVDACMRELNTTGYMHNRGRLIVSNFLCRLLHNDWKKGEQYFASKLYDYDPAQNNFGWQVSGSNSSGTTSRPLEQTIMNPWLQSIQFDKNGEYIKKWMPELVDVLPRDLHRWNEVCDKYIGSSGTGGVKYIKPIIDYKIEKEKNLKMYIKYL
jgi:deoxyribodipyrimidine photo-lyase